MSEQSFGNDLVLVRGYLGKFVRRYYHIPTKTNNIVVDYIDKPAWYKDTRRHVDERDVVFITQDEAEDLILRKI